MQLFIDGISGILLFVGSLFVIVGAVGLLRMPDLYTRIHAASVTDTGGATFIILGLLIQGVFVFEDVIVVIKLFLILFFIYFSAPTASHALAKMALMSHLVPKTEDGQSAVEASLVVESSDNNDQPHKSKGEA